MARILAYSVALFLAAAVARAEDPSAKEPSPGGDKLVSGMSIVGNDEAPKSLVIVPWKSSELGDSLDVSRLLDDGKQPVDREVFMRELTYYEIRAGAPDGRGSAPQ
ncbi:MAG: hypothetical protein JRG96_12480 [Deltaproteobacteria bacterium]|nr:hypothetical protein [Deltaproteobacteria bacterium]MBW2419973.1 hypothetical protein [Deltaproteobacteria bacterium]